MATTITIRFSPARLIGPVSCALGGLWLGAILVRGAWRQSVVIDGLRHFVLADDAMISMRYAYNLAHDRGLVWNPGNRVEGITNLGWTLAMALPYWLGASIRTAPFFVLATNIALHLALIALVFVWCWRRGHRIQAVTVAALVALDWPTFVWGMGGFETTCQALLVTLALLPFFDDGDTRFTPLWAALAVWVRPDSLLVFGWVAGMETYRLTKRRDKRLVYVIGGVLIVVMLFLFQRHYYGDWLPNTFHLKATGGAANVGRGILYVGDFIWRPTFGLPLLLAPVVYVAWKRRLAPVGALLLAWIAYLVLIGGDAFCCSRFFVPIIPVMALFVGALLEELLSAWDWRRLAPAVVLAALLWVRVYHGLELVPYLGLPSPTLRGSVLIAAELRKDVPTSAVIGVYLAGVTPYYMPEHRFHDFLGKSDRAIARTPAHPGPPGHNKWDYRYSLGHIKPDLIIDGVFDPSAEGEYRKNIAEGRDWGFLPALWLDPVFQAEYWPNRRLGDEQSRQWLYIRVPGPS